MYFSIQGSVCIKTFTNIKSLIKPTITLNRQVVINDHFTHQSWTGPTSRQSLLLFLMVCFTHAHPTLSWLHVHLRLQGPRLPRRPGLSCLDPVFLHQFLWKTGAMPSDVAMHGGATMRAKGLSGICSDHGRSESDTRQPCLVVHLCLASCLLQPV